MVCLTCKKPCKTQTFSPYKLPHCENCIPLEDDPEAYLCGYVPVIEKAK